MTESEAPAGVRTPLLGVTDRVACAAVWIYGGHIAAVALLTAILVATPPLCPYFGAQSGGDQLNFAVYIAHGRNYFSDPNHYPMLTPQTPGLFPLLLAPWVAWFGPSLLYGNILWVVSLLTTLAISAYKLCRNAALRKLLPLLNPEINLEFNAHFLDTALYHDLEPCRGWCPGRSGKLKRRFSPIWIESGRSNPFGKDEPP